MEIGYQTMPIGSWSSFADVSGFEENPDLRWPRSVDVYDRMRNEDAQVGSVLRAVTLPIMATTWEIDAEGVKPEIAEFIADNLGLPVRGRAPIARIRTRGRFSWSEHLRLALLQLVFGHSFFEQVYEPAGDLLRLRKLAWRPPRTIAEIEIARDGGLAAIQQYGGKKIPVDRLVAYVNEREGAAWVGRSLLRGCYKNWLLKDRELRSQALTIERNGLGVPVYEGAPVPDGATHDQAEAWINTQREEGLKIARKFRAGEDAGASIPNGASLKLLGVEGDLPDTEKPIRYHDEQIARSVLAHFLNLGTQTGSWALGATFADFFTGSLNAVTVQLADIANQHIIEDLVDLNWGEREPAPRLVASPIGVNEQAVDDAIKMLRDRGAIKDNVLESDSEAT